MSKSLLFPAVFCLSLLSQPARADGQSVYQWTDSDGRIHFSTQPEGRDARQSTLPPLQRENIDERIRDIKAQTPESCIPHGGIDCNRGADQDGSVICLDGFKDAVMPFQFECREAKLKAEYMISAGAGDELIPHGRNLIRKLGGKTPKSLQLTLRNLSGVEAFGIKTHIVFGRRFQFDATGPEKIPAYGTADYTLSLDSISPARTIAEIEQSRYKVECTNCSAITGSSAALTN
jgi:hypothetical protein